MFVECLCRLRDYDLNLLLFLLLLFQCRVTMVTVAIVAGLAASTVVIVIVVLCLCSSCVSSVGPYLVAHTLLLEVGLSHLSHWIFVLYRNPNSVTWPDAMMSILTFLRHTGNVLFVVLNLHPCNGSCDGV